MHRPRGDVGRSWMGVVAALVLGLSLVGCATIEIGGGETPPPIPPRFTLAETSVAVASRAEGETPPPIPPRFTLAETAVAVAARAEGEAAPVGADALAGDARVAPAMVVAQAPSGDASDADELEPYDPWEPFNEKMFEFNLRLDRYLVKPIANVYRKVIPEPFQILIANGFDNLRVVPRVVNNLLQGKPGGAGRELARFLINSTAGIGGLFDPAKDYWGIPSTREDFGQTLGVWGATPGPYLVLPLMEPMTVRDGIGRGVDTFLDPLGYVLPLFWDRLGMKIGEMINERALYYDLFQGFEETTLDFYSSVRHFYLQRRERLITE